MSALLTVNPNAEHVTPFELKGVRDFALEQVAEFANAAGSLFAELTGHLADRDERAAHNPLDTETGLLRMMAPWETVVRSQSDEVNYSTVDLGQFNLPKAIDQAILIETTTPKIGGERRDGPLTLLPLGYFDTPIAPPPPLMSEALAPAPKIEDERTAPPIRL